MLVTQALRRTFQRSQFQIASSTMSSYIPSVRYINGNELSAIIKSDKKPNQDYVVVDVRGDDYEGGNIKNAVNSPAETFLDEVDDLVAKTRDVPTVIFHCALSQARGPKAARIYAETRDRCQAEGKDKDHEVLVLRGGFAEFQAKYKDDAELVENWDKTIWESPYH